MRSPQPLSYAPPELPSPRCSKLAVLALAVGVGAGPVLPLVGRVADDFVSFPGDAAFLLLGYSLFSALLSTWAIIRAIRRRLQGRWLAVIGALLTGAWVLALFSMSVSRA